MEDENSKKHPNDKKPKTNEHKKPKLKKGKEGHVKPVGVHEIPTEAHGLQIPTRFSLHQPQYNPAADDDTKNIDPHTPTTPHKKHITHPYYEDVDDSKSEEDEDPLLKPFHHGKDHNHHPERNIIVRKREPNLESVLTYHEEVEKGEERHFANNLDEAFAPCRKLMTTLFRFPLQLTVRDDFSREFAYSWKSFRGWMFFITAGLIGLNGLLISASLAAVMLDFPRQPEEGYETNWTSTDEKLVVVDPSKPKTIQATLKSQQELRIEEQFLLQRNFIPMILLVLSLIHICTGDVSLFFKRTFIAKYFTFWDEAVEIMKMDVAKYPQSVKKYMVRITLFYIGYLIILLGLCAGRLAPVATGAPTQLVILWSRLFYPPIHAWAHLHYFRWAGIGMYIYLLMCSKVYILLLLYKCKILKNAYATWNERLQSVIHRGKGQGQHREKVRKSRREDCEKRTGFDHLFRDYVVLLDLLRGADTMFANVIESYFGTQVFSLCFEVYYFIRTFTAHDQFANARKLDGVLIGIYLAHSVIMLLLATNASAQVGEVAMEGLDIIRRNGCLGRKTNDEMYFTLSLYLSYTGHFETALTGGKFVTFDRSFIVALVGTIFTYYIILSQFTPPLAMLEPDKLEIINARSLILHVENTGDLGGLDVGY